MPHRFIILGAGGDLTGRYLAPALAGLFEQGQLHPDIKIQGVSQEDWADQQFQAHIVERLDAHAAKLKPESRQKLVSALSYRQLDVTDGDRLQELVAEGGDPVILYLALPPTVAGKVLEALRDVEMPADSRIVVEKPFGHDLKSARHLNELLHRSFPERSVFRMDHFLGKQTVQNVLGLRFANRMFEYLWNRDHVEQVTITWDETVALEGRAGYYDHAGALKDMVQNHLLQLLALVAMEAPASFAEDDFRTCKTQVFRAVRRLSDAEIPKFTRRARYSAGRVGDRDIPNYKDEQGVDPSRNTETFAEVTLFIDNWRWTGVPFVLRTGKALAADRHEIEIRFRPVPHLAFEDTMPAPNVLRLGLNPDRLELEVNINGSGDPFDLERARLDTVLAPHDTSAYGRLLLDVIQGNAVLSIRGDEAEESWAIVEPILAAWRENRVPLEEYPAGSGGPAR